MPNIKKVLPLDRIYKEIVKEGPSITKKPLPRLGFLRELDNDITREAEERIRRIESENMELEKARGSRYREDRYGNPIGNGTYHAKYTVYDIPGTEVTISPSTNSESVYVTYVNPGKGTSKSRYSNHFSNQEYKGPLDILSELGMVRSEPRIEKKLVGWNVKKREIESYPSSGKTYEDLLELPEDEMKKYKGMLIVDENGNKKNWMFDGAPWNLEVGRDYFIKDEYAPLFEDYYKTPTKK